MFRRRTGVDVAVAAALAAVAVVLLLALVVVSVVFAQSEEPLDATRAVRRVTLPPISTPTRSATVTPSPTATPTAFRTLPPLPTATSTPAPFPTPESEEVILSSVEVPTRTPRTPPSTPTLPAATSTPAAAAPASTPSPAVSTPTLTPRAATPTPARPSPTPTPTETDAQKLLRLALQVLNMRQSIFHSMTEGMRATNLELEVGGKDCTLYAEVTEYANEEYVLSSSVYEYRDAGCDARVDVAWTDKYRARGPGNEASFLVEDRKYQGWVVTMAQHEGLLK